jgi:protein PhnA
VFWPGSGSNSAMPSMTGVAFDVAHGARACQNPPSITEAPMAGDDDYIYDEATGEWRPAGEAVPPAAVEGIVVRDAAGSTLMDGDSVTLIKDLKVKGTNTTLKQGTVIRSIRLTADPDEIDCRHDGIKGLVLRNEFVRKR